MSINAKMTAIADAIRGKTGKIDALTLDQMAVEIGGIVTEPTLEELTITENGEYAPGEGVDGFSKVVANIESAGGGGSDFSFVSANMDVYAAVITIGANTVAYFSAMQAYFQGVLGIDHAVTAVVLLDTIGEAGVNNQMIYYGPLSNNTAGFYRYRGGAINFAQTADSYDLALAEGTRYYVAAVRWISA